MKTEINPEALYWASFNRFELRLSGAAVMDCSHSGQCDDDVAHHAPLVRAQMESDNFQNRPTPDKIRVELSEYGAWEDAELADDAANWLRLVWIAASNIREEESPDCSEPLATNRALRDVRAPRRAYSANDPEAIISWPSLKGSGA